MKHIKAIVINAQTRTISEVTIENTLEAKQAIVGGLIERATTLPNGDDVYVNEEGLFLFDRFFYLTGEYSPFAGNAVVVGHDGQGNAVDAKSKREDFDDQIIFMGKDDVMKMLAD